MDIAIDKIYPNPEQPRKEFDKEQLKELANSIRQNGVIVAISVEEAGGGTYILHDGERRLKAAKMAGLKTIPAKVTPALNGNGQQERLIRALVANVQRADLNAIEEARAYGLMHERHGLTQQEIAERCGVNWSRVMMRMKLLKLDPEIQELIGEGKLPISVQVADALLKIPDSGVRVSLSKKAAGKKLSNQAIINMAARLVEALEKEPEDVPALPILAQASRRSKGFVRAKWDMMAQVGSVPPWSVASLAAMEVCNACVLKPMASAITCKECPGAQLLGTMMRKASA